LLYFHPFFSSIAFLYVPFSLVLSIVISSYILYIRALTYTSKLFQGLYYFAAIVCSFVIYFLSF
jgi:hypothetical protein